MQAAGLNGSAALLPQSIMRILATCEAGLTYELYSFLDYISLMSVPVTATGEFLEMWANLKGVYRNPATFASGTTSFTGTSGTHVPAGSIISTTGNVQYATNSDYVIGTSPPTGFTALVAGVSGNAASGIALTLQTPIAGVTSATTAATPIVGGTDQELDASLRSRMLAVYSAPPNGGSANDYIEWAEQVPGVTRAWALGSGVGAGSVLVWIMLDEAQAAHGGFGQGTPGGATLETRIAHATGDMLTVANWIYPRRPVTALVSVATPLTYSVNFAIQSLSPSDTGTELAIRNALSDLFVRLGSPLGTTSIYGSDVNAAIDSVAGINRYTLIAPIAPISTPVGYLPIVGNITWS